MLLRTLFYMAVMPFYSLFVSGKEKLPIKISYSRVAFLPESKMYFMGSTNINSYTCDCVAPSGVIPLYFENIDNKLVFKNISVVIPTTTIDCQNKLYNRNIRKTLSADHYPSIRVNLVEAWKENCTSNANEFEWFDVVSKANITIKDVTKLEEVKGKAICLSNNKYRIKGSQVLNMKDFGLEAPKFMLGLIKVEEQIVFHFDLIIELIY